MNFNRVIFLDFDGVLHPQVCAERDHFCFLPNFSQAFKTAASFQSTPIVEIRLTSLRKALRGETQCYKSRMGANGTKSSFLKYIRAVIFESSVFASALVTQ
jgi:hypothetical protein